MDDLPDFSGVKRLVGAGIFFWLAFNLLGRVMGKFFWNIFGAAVTTPIATVLFVTSFLIVLTSLLLGCVWWVIAREDLGTNIRTTFYVGAFTIVTISIVNAFADYAWTRIGIFFNPYAFDLYLFDWTYLLFTAVAAGLGGVFAIYLQKWRYAGR